MHVMGNLELDIPSGADQAQPGTHPPAAAGLFDGLSQEQLVVEVFGGTDMLGGTDPKDPKDMLGGTDLDDMPSYLRMLCMPV